jgi:hypothetical protein
VGGSVGSIDVGGLDHDACDSTRVFYRHQISTGVLATVALAPALAPLLASRLWSPTQIAILHEVAELDLTESGLITVGPKRPTFRLL